MGYSKEKQQKLVQALTHIGALAGDNKIGVADNVKGLELSAEQARCEETAQAVRDGLFKVVVMGTFSSGKSTVINALIGAKVLPEAAGPCTAILSFIKYGADENNVEVYMADEKQADGKIKPGECIRMSVDEFQNKYKYTSQDEADAKKLGYVPRFAKVKYAIISCAKPLMEGGVTIIDSPGLQDKKVATDLALDIAQKAQAIIYVALDRGFDEPDREYIGANFRNCPNNVFFLLNKLDLVKAAEREYSLQKMRNEVEAVFTRADGTVNKELLNRRVFGLSALHALDARRGMQYDSIEEEDVPLDEAKKQKLYEKSLFAPFEQELETFLTTDERCIAQYQNSFVQMATTYRKAGQQIKDYINIYQNEIKLDDDKRAECEKIISEIKQHIQVTETTFDNCSLKIQNALTTLMRGCAGNLDATWDQDMQGLADQIDMGTFKYMWEGIKMIMSGKEKKEAQMKEFIEPFVQVVSTYFVDRLDEYIRSNKSVVEKEMNECQKTLDVELGYTDQLFQNLSDGLVSGHTVQVNSTGGNWIQLILSAYLGDFSAMVKGGIEGQTPWMEFFKKTLFNTLWQAIVLYVLSAPGALLVLAVEYLQGQNNKHQTVRKILNNSKEGIMKVIAEQSEKMQDNLNQKVAAEMMRKKDQKCADYRRKVADEEARLKAIDKFYSDHNATLEKEEARFNKILTAMFSEAKEAYQVVFDKELKLEQFKQF